MYCIRLFTWFLFLTWFIRLFGLRSGKVEGFGAKTISFWGGISLLINNITGLFYFFVFFLLAYIDYLVVAARSYLC